VFVVVVVVACCCHRFFFFWAEFHLLVPSVANLVHRHWKILNNYLLKKQSPVSKKGEEGCQQRIVKHHFRQKNKHSDHHLLNELDSMSSFGYM
jgi:hypothetical protein